MIEPYVLKPEEHPVFMAAMLNGITWGFKPNKDGVVNGDGYCMGDLNVHTIVMRLYYENVLNIEYPNLLFAQGTRSIKVG